MELIVAGIFGALFLLWILLTWAQNSFFEIKIKELLETDYRYKVEKVRIDHIRKDPTNRKNLYVTATVLYDGNQTITRDFYYDGQSKTLV